MDDDNVFGCEAGRGQNVTESQVARGGISLVHERDVSWGSRRFTEYRAAGSNASAGLAPGEVDNHAAEP